MTAVPRPSALFIRVLTNVHEIIRLLISFQRIKDKTRQKSLQNNRGPMLSKLQLAFLAFLAGISKVVEEAEQEQEATVLSC